MMNKLKLFLVIICLTASIAFAVNNKESDILRKIMPGADIFSDKKSSGGIEYFEAIKGRDVIGYCINVTSNGYCGPIHILFGIDKTGVIQGMEILEHRETAGIGSRITEDNFLTRFKGKHAADIVMGKNIDAVTGATVSSKVVIDSIHDTAERFIRLRNQHAIE